MLRAMATQDDPLKLERLASAARIPVGEAEALLDVLEFDGVVRRIAMRRHRRLKNWTATDGFTLALPLAQIYLDTLAKCLVYDGDAVVLSTLHLDDPLTDTLRGLGKNLPRVSLDQLFAPTEPRT